MASPRGGAPVSDLPSLIPFRLRIGVSGHRELSDVHELERSVASVLDQIAARFAPERTPLVFTAVSPIAEGADRLVAHTVLKRAGADLIVLLPFAAERYLEDFVTESSKAEFQSLLEQAVSHSVVDEEYPVSDEEGYERVGRAVVEQADVLIALWDGCPARGLGGTASIVEFARRGALERSDSTASARGLTPLKNDRGGVGGRRIPVYVVRTDRQGAIETSFDDGDWDDVRAAYGELDHFNHFRAPKRMSRRVAVRSRAELRGPLERLRATGGDPRELARVEAMTERLERWALPAFCQADTGARSFRNEVAAIGVGTALFAAAAVAAAAARVVLVPHASILTWMEVGFMATVLAGRLAVMRHRAHRRWVSFRALAEIVRVLPYVALAAGGDSSGPNLGGVPGARGGRPPTVQLEWFRRAVEELWKHRPALDLDRNELAEFQKLTLALWIGGQIEYHKRRSEQHRIWHRLLRGGVLGAFAGTLACALLDALGQGGEITVFLTIGLPALGGALGYIEGHREHGRHAQRYRWTLSQLAELQRRGDRATDRRELAVVTRLMLDLMHAENADWADVMWVRDLELAL